MYKNEYGKIMSGKIMSGKNANKRNNIHICTYPDKNLPRGYRRIPTTLCDKDKLLHIPNIDKNADVNCIHYGHDGICNLHGGFCGNLKPKIHHVKAKEYTNTLLTTKKVDKLIGLMADIKTDRDKLIIEIAFGDFDMALSGHGSVYAERLKKELMDMVD